MVGLADERGRGVFGDAGRLHGRLLGSDRRADPVIDVQKNASVVRHEKIKDFGTGNQGTRS